jgi:hypothetical protein
MPLMVPKRMRILNAVIINPYINLGQRYQAYRNK